MDIIPDRLSRAIRQHFKNQREFAEAIGTHESTVSKWLRGERAVPIEAVQVLAALGVSVDFLTGLSDRMTTDSPDSSKAQMERVFNRIQAEYDNDRAGLPGITFASPGIEIGGVIPREHRIAFSNKKTRLGPDIEKLSVDQKTEVDVVIPMLESSIPAGYKVPIYEDISTAFNVTQYYKDCFTMRVRGDSMIGSGIEDGDRVIIKRGHRFRNGDVIAAVVDGEVTLKAVWTRESRVYLVPANSKYPIYEVPESSEFQSLGVCIDTFRPPKKVDWREK